MNRTSAAGTTRLLPDSESGDTLSSAAVRTPSLRILWVKVGGLWPLNTGGRLRSFHIIRELARQHEISVITTHSPGEDGGSLARELWQCQRVQSVVYAPAKRDSIRFLLALVCSWLTHFPVDLYKNRIAELEREVRRSLRTGQFDLCVADFLFAAPNVPRHEATPLLFFAHNVEYMIWRRLADAETGFLRKMVLGLEWRKMRRYEHSVCERAGLSIAVSEQDRQLLCEGVPESRVRAIPTGVDLDYFRANQSTSEQPLEIVFTGSMDWHPNEDAMLYFMDTILPLLRAEFPTVSMTVAGRNPGARLQAAASTASVRLTGTVEDVRPYMERAAVYVVPLRIGGGTRLKIYEALAMGKAVVSTTIGAEGLPLEEGVHILLADEPTAFAEQVSALLRDPGRRRVLGNAGRQLMEQRYSWSKVARDFELHCREWLQ